MDLFEKRLLAEGIRAIEKDSPTLSIHAPPAFGQGSNSFENILLVRALQLDEQLQISRLFLHFKRLTKQFFALLALFLLICGASTAQHFFFTEQGAQINFFWLFALFFIPNFIALFLWLFFFLRPIQFSNGWLARVSLFLLKIVEKYFNPQAVNHPHFWILFKCYFKVSFSSLFGRYQLSAVTHLLWFSYFCGATFMLVIMLATHQVDFVWQTSILSQQNFQWLTEGLAYIPNLLGIAVPSVEQIQHSHFGETNLFFDAQNSRFLWSSLLLGSLFIYGVVPRFLLWLLMLLLLKVKRKQFSLNLSVPYYVQLRQFLKPNVSSLGIIDPDTVNAGLPSEGDSTPVQQQLPSIFYPVALELSCEQFVICKKHVQEYMQLDIESLVNICDFNSQKILLAEILTIQQPSVALYVALSRVPDRGLMNFIKSLTSLTVKPFYLVLIDDASGASDVNNRRSDWYTLAAKANISLDSIINLINKKEA